MTKFIIVLGNSKREISKLRLERAKKEFLKLTNIHPYKLTNASDGYNEQVEDVKLILSGIEADVMFEICTKELGMNESVLVKEPNSRNTHENILFTKQLLDRSYGSTTFDILKPSLIICTSSSHIKRAMLYSKFILEPNYVISDYIFTDEIFTYAEAEKENKGIIFAMDFFLNDHIRRKMLYGKNFS